jgi:hypothetical protein
MERENRENRENREKMEIVVVAPDGSVFSATSWREVAELARAYREGR